MEKVRYFSNIMAISQNYNQGNHRTHNGSNYNDYPIDETYGSSKRTGYFLAPCTMKVVKKYGPAVGNKCVTNQIWLTSVDEVQMPCGTGYLSCFVGHISNADMNNIRIGSVYNQGSKICMEWKDANSTGYHNHVAFGLGTLKGSGWAKNKKGAWVLTTTGGTIKPEQAMYINDNVTIINNQGLSFEKEPEDKKEEYTAGYYTLLYAKYLRKTPSLGNNYVKVKETTQAIRGKLSSKNPNANAQIIKGTTITITEIYNENNRIWGKNYSGWVVLQNIDGTPQATKVS
nr:MAG TPA: hypothetical protein [Caudoviricetes sp.]